MPHEGKRYEETTGDAWFCWGLISDCGSGTSAELRRLETDNDWVQEGMLARLAAALQRGQIQAVMGVQEGQGGEDCLVCTPLFVMRVIPSAYRGPGTYAEAAKMGHDSTLQ